MEISALTTSLAADLAKAIQQLAALGFEWIDVPPTAADGAARRIIQQRNLKIGCVGLEHDLPRPFDLASHKSEMRKQSLTYLEQLQT